MNKSKLMAVGAHIALLATLTRRATRNAHKRTDDSLAVGVGTVRTVVDEQVAAHAGERQIWIEVASVDGDTFVGRLVHDNPGADLSTLRPGLVMLVAFDPAAREELSLPDDVLAVRAQGLALV